MMNARGIPKKFIVAALLLMFMLAVPAVMALPTHQGFPCFGGEGCPEPVNPEEGEYYAIQCTTNAVWTWASAPNPSLVTFVSLFPIDALNDGDSLVAPNNVTVTRSGDTITLSGENGNLAPQPGEKSFSWSECIERNGGLPELPPVGVELTDEQIACMSLPTEQEVVDCLNALEPQPPTPNPQTCDNEIYRATHAQECTLVSCPLDPSIRVVNLSDCPTAQEVIEYRWRDALNEAIHLCLSFSISMVGGSFAIWRRRKRK